MKLTKRIAVKDIRKGDEFWSDGEHAVHHWTALADASDVVPVDMDYKASVRVQFAADGGIDYRFWADANQEITVRR